MMTYNDYLKQIIAFNSDKDIIALREKFNKPSFFEIISKERSETTYSAFLKWLLKENNSGQETCNPISLLLDVLVRRSEEQKGNICSILNDECIKRNIVTRNLAIQTVNVETEKLVSSLAQEIIRPNRTGVIGALDLAKIAAKSKDRIDLLVECEIESNDERITAKRMQIIIENKIDSVEGGKKLAQRTGVAKYDDASQTERYYLGTKFSTLVGGQAVDGEDVLQVYVYLAPQTSEQGSCTDTHFIHINYQDIVDGILTPMLASSSLSERSHFFLNEFLNQLVFPSLDGTVMRPSIAVGKQYSDELTKMWKKYQPLLADAAIAASEINLWMIDGTYYDHQPRTELLKLLLEKNVQTTDIVNGQWKSRMHYSKMKDLAASVGIEMDMVTLVLDDDTQELLSSFWDKNKRLLTAVINGMKAEERKKVEALLCQLSKRDTTKYNVYYNDKPIGVNLGKAQAAFCIIKEWSEQQKSEGKAVTQDVLRETFPIAYNPYYAPGKYFKHLFYEVNDNPEYDGTEAKGPVQGNWDFDKKGRFNIDTTDEKTVTMLKMWRKDSLEHLIKMVAEKKLFNGTLDVVPVE